MGTLALGGRRQRHHLAAARVQALRHPFDDATLAGGVAAFEQDEDLELLVDHPILELDELLLQPQQFLEIEATSDLIGAGASFFQQSREPIVVDFELEFLIDAVDEFIVDPLAQARLGRVGAHWHPVRQCGRQRPGPDRPEASRGSSGRSDVGVHP